MKHLFEFFHLFESSFIWESGDMYRQSSVKIPPTKNTSSNNTLHLYVKEFYYLMCPPLSFDHRNIEINNTDKPSLCTCLFIGITRLSFIRLTELEPSIYLKTFLQEGFHTIDLLSIQIDKYDIYEFHFAY